jgi:hypothetical protein
MNQYSRESVSVLSKREREQNRLFTDVLSIKNRSRTDRTGRESPHINLFSCPRTITLRTCAFFILVMMICSNALEQIKQNPRAGNEQENNENGV